MRNVIARYCEFFRISQTAPDQQTMLEMIEAYRRYGVDYFVDAVYTNKQRTSTSSGILKAEAAYRFASVLSSHGVDIMKDVPKVYNDPAFEAEIRSIPGQSSGLSLRYFFMLSGNDDFVKPDRMITRFLQRVLERATSMKEAQFLISSACESLKPEYPNLTPRLLDHAIWNFARHFGEGRGIFLCFYKEGNQARLQHWLEKILPFKSNIENQLGQEVKIGFWSDQWAFIGMRIDEAIPGAQPAEFAKIFVQFIQATFIPISHIASEYVI